MSRDLKNLLNVIVKEEGISDIIIENKTEMDLSHSLKLYTQWSNIEKKLTNELTQAKHNLHFLKFKIKSLCKHTDVTDYYSSHHTYCCNQCGFDVQIHDEFNFRNITKIIDI